MIFLDLIVKLQVYIVPLLILLILYIQLKEESQSFSLNDQLFSYLILSTMATLIFEATSWAANGNTGTTAYIMNVSSNTLLLAINTVPLTMWALYIIATVNQEKQIVIKYAAILGIPVVINMLIALSTPINQKYFYIDENNLYHRGEWANIAIAIHGALFITDILITLYNWGRINQRNRVPMLFFLVPPMAGFIGQMKFYGTSLVWPGATVSILMSYIMIQSQVVKTDYLTGLYNRRELDSYIDRKIRSLPQGKFFAGLMIDLDDFKEINDKYGHAVGDQAIKVAAFLIKKSVKKDDFVARYGGDEFLIILDIKTEEELNYKINNIKKQFKLFNDKNEEIFKLKISIGGSIYTKESGQGEAFIHHLDQLMYENKCERKLRKVVGG